MNRREFIALVAGAIATAPRIARAQDRVRRIGILMAFSKDDPTNRIYLSALREGLHKLGWAEDRNIRTDTRWMTDADGMLRAVQDLVAGRPDLLIAQNTPAALALLQETRSIPIIFASVSDPIGEGFVASLARPAGNLTGFIDVEAAMAGKWVELLKEIAPRVARVAITFNPATAPRGGSYYLGPFKTAAAALGMQAVEAPVRDMAELEAAVAAQAREPDGGIVSMPDSFLRNRSTELIALAARHRLPAVYPSRYYSDVGGLMSYGNDNADNWRRAASYVDRILKGEKPDELPVQVPVKFELVINLKTANALGLPVPWILQQRADEVIE
jgi:putative ABC transport system substrate-binding protein